MSPYSARWVLRAFVILIIWIHSRKIEKKKLIMKGVSLTHDFKDVFFPRPKVRMRNSTSVVGRFTYAIKFE